MRHQSCSRTGIFRPGIRLRNKRRCRNTKSWGNIKGSGPAGSYHGFRAYHDYKEGVDDWYQLIKDKYVDKWGLKTVGGILQKYAPPSENNTRQYVQNAKGMVQGWAQNENKTLNA